MLIKQYLQRFFDIRPFKYQTARSFGMLWCTGI